MSSRNSVKARAAALGVELRRESSTRTVWPAEYVALGLRLAEHLIFVGTLGCFGPSVTAATDGSDGLSQVAPLAPGDGSKRPRRSGGLSLMAPTDGSDAMVALVQSHLLRLGRMAAAMAPPLPRQTPCTVTTQRFADSLTNPELAHLLCTGPGRSC